MPACVGTAIQNAPLTDAVINFIAPSFEWPETKTLNLTYDRQIGDWLMTATYLHSDQEEALYKIIDGSPLSGDQPLTPTLKAPDGRPIYNQTGGRGTYKGGLYNQGGGEREVISVAFSREGYRYYLSFSSTLIIKTTFISTSTTCLVINWSSIRRFQCWS